MNYSVSFTDELPSHKRCADTGGKAIARLVDRDALGRAALEGGSVEVVVSVPVNAFASAYRLLRPIMDDGAPDLEAWLTEEGRSEDELRLLCGLLCTVEDNLPMDTAHHLAWLEKTGFDQQLDEFAASRLKRNSRGGLFKFLSEADLVSARERFDAWNTHNN